MDEERESPRDWGKVGDGAVIAGQVFVPLRSSWNPSVWLWGPSGELFPWRWENLARQRWKFGYRGHKEEMHISFSLSYLVFLEAPWGSFWDHKGRAVNIFGLIQGLGWTCRVRVDQATYTGCHGPVNHMLHGRSWVHWILGFSHHLMEAASSLRTSSSYGQFTTGQLARNQFPKHQFAEELTY